MRITDGFTGTIKSSSVAHVLSNYLDVDVNCYQNLLFLTAYITFSLRPISWKKGNHYSGMLLHYKMKTVTTK